MRFKAYLLISGLLACLNVTAASPVSPSVIELHDGANHLAVIQKIDYYLDTTSSKTVQEISSKQFQDRFQPVRTNNIVPGSLEDEIWL